MKSLQETRLEINLNALRHNFQVIKKRIKPTTKIMGVVKAFAYGTDSVAVGKTLHELGVHYLAVAYIEEGVRLRQSGITCPILIFYPQLEKLRHLLDYELIPSVYNFHFLRSLHQTLEKKGATYFPVHLKINTGMNRLGFDEHQFEEAKVFFSDRKTLKLVGIFSHLAASGVTKERAFTRQQIERFKYAVKFFDDYAYEHLITHICNSSGILNFAEAEMDMVRTGIALYGYGNNPTEHKLFKPVVSLKAPITQLRWIKKGESVGYDRKYMATAKRLIATLPLGYADGISRQYGNRNALVKLNGKVAPIIGNVCMDTLMVDVTGIKCAEGDSVLIFGEGHTAVDFDFKNLSIPYELISRISRRVTRVIIED